MRLSFTGLSIENSRQALNESLSRTCIRPKFIVLSRENSHEPFSFNGLSKCTRALHPLVYQERTTKLLFEVLVYQESIIALYS